MGILLLEVMLMYELKTKINDGDVLEFLNKVENKRRKEDSLIVLDLMKKVTGEDPKMWGQVLLVLVYTPIRTKVV